MASCVTMKRSYDHDRESSNSSTYEPRATASAKRVRRLQPVTVVSSATEMNDLSMGTPSVFPDLQPIASTDALLTRIKEEVRRLQRRHQLKATSAELSDDEATASPSNTTDSTTTTTSNSSGQQESRLSSPTQQHLLTLKQVNMICARLLKEREELLREEYDQVLSNKLNEQYEGFVRFTQDQLTRRFSELQFSYVS